MAEVSEFQIDGIVGIALHACESVEACDNELAELKEQKKQLEVELQEAKNQEHSLTAEMMTLQKSINLSTAELTKIEASITALLEEIVQLEADITHKEEEVKKILQQQQKEMNGNVYLALLLSSKSLSDFMLKLNAVGTINGAKQKYLTELQEAKMELETAKVKLDEQKSAVATNKAEYEKLLTAADDTLEKLQKQTAATEDRLGDIEMSEDELNRQREIVDRPSRPNDTGGTSDDSNNESSGSGAGVPSSNGWHLPAATGVLSCPVLCYADHLGTDFGMLIGTEVYAIADGVVIYTKYDWGTTGYGTMIIIAHEIEGVPHISIYGHLSGINVAAGDVVRGGQFIGRSGHTGASTAPHLHVEIIRNTNIFREKSFRRLNYIDARNVLPNPGNNWRW